VQVLNKDEVPPMQFHKLLQAHRPSLINLLLLAEEDVLENLMYNAGLFVVHLVAKHLVLMFKVPVAAEENGWHRNQINNYRQYPNDRSSKDSYYDSDYVLIAVIFSVVSS